MGNTQSSVERRPSVERDVDEDLNAVMDARAFLQEANVDYADYQQTLHQFLSQRYADRYISRQRSYQQQQQQERRNSFESGQSLKESRSKAASTEVVALILKQQNLEQVPLEVFAQTDVTSLDLSGNNLIEVPKQLKNLKRLTRLALGSNQLISLPQEIGGLKELTWLDFTHNRISILPSTFADLKKLTSLGASDCRLSAFPQEICELTNLRKLGVFNNLFTALPASIGNLAHLTKLDLSGNALVSLPPEIGKLTELTWLNLSNNRLEELPEELGNLTKLEELGLAHNRLKKLPNLSRLNCLTLLPVYNNELEELGDWIGEMQLLNKLDLSCNQLAQVPDTILLPKNLSFLNLRKNCLKTLPDSIFDARIGASVRLPSPLQLVTVDVRENEFEYLPVNLIGPALVELKTANNAWKPRCEGFNIDTYKTPIPSLLDLVCSKVLQNEQHHGLLAHIPRPIQLHVLRKSKRCHHCEKPITHSGIECFVWRATTDTPEVPFKANVCSRPCLRSLDGHPIFE